jgi:hypothetical protein
MTHIVQRLRECAVRQRRCTPFQALPPLIQNEIFDEKSFYEPWRRLSDEEARMFLLFVALKREGELTIDGLIAQRELA